MESIRPVFFVAHISPGHFESDFLRIFAYRGRLQICTFFQPKSGLEVYEVYHGNHYDRVDVDKYVMKYRIVVST